MRGDWEELEALKPQPWNWGRVAVGTGFVVFGALLWVGSGCAFGAAPPPQAPPVQAPPVKTPDTPAAGARVVLASDSLQPPPVLVPGWWVQGADGLWRFQTTAPETPRPFVPAPATGASTRGTTVLPVVRPSTSWPAGTATTPTRTSAPAVRLPGGIRDACGALG